MIRFSVLAVVLCHLLLPSGPAAAQPVPISAALPAHEPGALASCSDACSTVVPGIAAIASVAFAPQTEGSAGQGKGLRIDIAPVTLVEPATRARLQLQIGPSDALPKNSLIRLRGLPPAVSVPQGHVVTAGVWAVPVAAVAELSLILPDGLLGWSEVGVAVVTTDGKTLAQAKTKLVVALPSRSQAVTGHTPGLTPEDRERALQFHAQGVEQLEIGNIIAARRFFERATEAGLAQSVMALARTYDPEELAKLGTFGPQPDVETARRWYRKARDLGAVDAGERLRRLGAP